MQEGPALTGGDPLTELVNAMLAFDGVTAGFVAGRKIVSGTQTRCLAFRACTSTDSDPQVRAGLVLSLVKRKDAEARPSFV